MSFGFPICVWAHSTISAGKTHSEYGPASQIWLITIDNMRKRQCIKTDVSTTANHESILGCMELRHRSDFRNRPHPPLDWPSKTATRGVSKLYFIQWLSVYAMCGESEKTTSEKWKDYKQCIDTLGMCEN